MPTSICTDTLSHPHYPSPRTKLASLVKGRWIDGKAQTVALLHFCLRYIRLFYSPNFLPSRRRDCHTNLSKTALSNPLFVGRGSVCACMVLHPCKTQGTHAKASLPCLPLPSRPTFPSPQPSQKHLNRLASHHHPCLLMNAPEVLSCKKELSIACYHSQS